MRGKTRRNKSMQIPPAVAEGGIDLLELLIEVGGKRKRTRRRKNQRRK